MKMKYLLMGVLACGCFEAQAAVNFGVTINLYGTNKDGVSGIMVLSQSGLNVCPNNMLYITDKALQATILAGFSQGKKIFKMQWTNTTTQVDLGGDLTTCRVDYATFEP